MPQPGVRYDVPQDQKNLALISTLGMIIAGFIPPLIVFIVTNGDASKKFANDHAKEGLNFCIALFVAWMAAFLLMIVLIGFLLIPVLIGWWLWVIIAGSIEANNGEAPHYPLVPKILKSSGGRAPARPCAKMVRVTHILDDFLARGLIADTTDLGALRELLDTGPVSLYCGFDPTATSLHLGNLVQLLTLRRFQLAGHRPIALVGGATGLIGDPRNSAERRMNPADQVAEWTGRIRSRRSAASSTSPVRTRRSSWTTTTGPLGCLPSISCATSASTSA